MKTLLTSLFLFSVLSLFAQRNMTFDIIPIVDVEVKSADLRPAYGVYFNGVNQRGFGFGIKFSFGRQQSIAGSTPVNYFTATGGYVQDIWEDKFTFYVGGGVMRYIEWNPTNGYVLPAASTYIVWHTKRFRWLDFLLGMDVGFVNNNLYPRSQTSNFPVRAVIGVGANL
jgi:hypothetical protein